MLTSPPASAPRSPRRRSGAADTASSHRLGPNRSSPERIPPRPGRRSPRAATKGAVARRALRGRRRLRSLPALKLVRMSMPRARGYGSTGPKRGTVSLMATAPPRPRSAPRASPWLRATVPDLAFAVSWRSIAPRPLRQSRTRPNLVSRYNLEHVDHPQRA